MKKNKSKGLAFSWSDPTFRSIVYQIIVLGLVAAGVWYLVSNTMHNLQVRNIRSGFDFLGREAGFAIGESLIDYSPTDTYWRAILVGLLNTLYVSLAGIVLATLLGVVIGVARLSKNWLIAKLAAVYVEVLRNIPLLIQLFFWYALIVETLPGPRQAMHPVPGVFLSNRGLRFPAAQGESLVWIVAGAVVALLLTLAAGRYLRRRQIQTGTQTALWPIGLALFILLPVAGFFFGGGQLAFSIPELKGFNFAGGASISPELTALLSGLVIYTSAFVAEIVRSGIQAVPGGQWEAAGSVGLSRRRALRLVVLPQALRIMIPPLTSTYLNLMKNSSLAVAIGYPDIVSIINTTLNQTGQAIEGILIVMAAYLTVSLSISLFMNWYNRRIALVER
ncbi:amino acid ABC transporter membrane protein 1 (PAAT family) [Advenella incenata]|jgi:general L-amino acid transport system permease protein|uniref:Amino acid ABC transporter membrane protein 1 (PAAT family) n=1 Tax=Advenella incenata TaxID=267800 RepID=A0A4Q7VSM2_9BURK|nr:amino acid ABC transporter permease [Advenella incenata]RZT99354.1 amino acid ABC transporter membrane protein 1 (PAAT family) [Advenella incenata]